MKKLICLVLALVACLAIVTAVSATNDTVAAKTGEDDASVQWKCAHCNDTVTWELLPSAVPETPGHYHYYLAGAVTPGQLLVKSGVTMCLDLAGYGIDVTGRAMIVNNGGVANIMDSSEAQSGYLAGSDRRGNNVAGGTVTVQENATLNLYSGTLKFAVTENNSVVEYGGTVYLKTNSTDKTTVATMNMYGGRVEGGTLKADSSIKGGAAIYVNTDAVLNVYGGTITSGSIPDGVKGACVLLDTSTSRMQLSGSANVEEIYTVNTSGLTVSGTFSGKARLKLHRDVSDGLAVGNSDDADITGDLFCTNGDGWLVEVSEEDTLVLSAYTPTPERHFCTHCNEVIRWTKLTSDVCTQLKSTVGSYHCYLDGAFNRSKQVSLEAGSQLCLDLYGNDLTVAQRALYVRADAQLSIMDSQGGGEVVGTTGTNNPTGGVMVVKAGATFNLYGGTLRLNAVYKEGYGVGVGGVIYMSESGTVNVFGGTIQGADLVMSEYNLNPNGKGAAIYMANSAQLNVSGGQITAGTLAEGCEGVCVYLNSSTAKVTVSGNGKVEDIYCKYENDQLTISGAYTGTVNLTYPDTVTTEEGMVVGVSDGADLSAADTGCDEQWMLGVSENSLVLVPNAPVLLQSDSGSVSYTTLQGAINDAQESDTVKLLKSVTEDVTLSGDLHLDLNGKLLNGTVTVPAGATLYGKDTQTDDFNVNDAAGYGKLRVTGEGNVTGIEDAGLIYLMVTEEDGVSFHAVNLEIKAMSLRAEDVGLYYKSDFACDEVVAQQVVKFGVALSLVETPTLTNLDVCVLSEIPGGFTSGGMDADATSTLVKNVMRDTNPALVNNRNAKLPIYGRAYILTESGYIMGTPVQRSFRQQVEMIDAIWTDPSMTSEKKAGMVEMYTRFLTVMKNWNIPNIIAQNDPSTDNVLKILGIGNSYTVDSMRVLYNIYKEENPDKEVVLGIAYYGGCSLAKHVSFIEGNSPEYAFYKISDEIYEEKGTWKNTSSVTLKSIVENENWDIVTMQQASTYSGVASTYNEDIRTIQRYVTNTLCYTPTFAWNMTWAYPVEDIEGDAFVTVNTTDGFASRYNSDQMTMFNAIVDAVKEKIVPDTTFTYLMPTGLSVQNANSSYLGDPDLYRDYTHLNDFARVMAAYVWYCTFENVQLDTLKFTVIPRALTNSYKTAGGTGDMVLTQQQIAIIQESVKNALITKTAGTFALTQSQYTESPS